MDMMETAAESLKRIRQPHKMFDMGPCKNGAPEDAELPCILISRNFRLLQGKCQYYSDLIAS